MTAREHFSTRSRNLLSFRGRATGGEVLRAFAFVLVLGGIVRLIGDLLTDLNTDPVRSLVYALLLPPLSRRLHDTGRSGWWAAIFGCGLLLGTSWSSREVLPFTIADILVIGVALAQLWVFWLLLQAGDYGPNRFGPDPRLGPEQFGAPQPSPASAV